MQGNVRKRGKKWYYRFDIADKNGKRQQYERVGGNTRAEALNALREALNIFQNTNSLPSADRLSTYDYMEYWFENYVEKNLSKNTQSNYRNVLDKYIQPTLGKYRLKDLTPATLQKWINDIATSKEYKRDHTKLSKHSVEIILMVIKEALKQAVHPWQLLHESPAIYISMPKYQDKPTSRESLKVITVNQFKQIINLFDKDDPRVIPFYISFYTGMRRGEVCGLEWSSVNLYNQTITVHQQMKEYSKTDIRIGSVKTAASNRTIVIGEELVSILKHHQLQQRKNQLRYGDYYYKSDFVCTKSNGKPITPSSIKYLSTKIQQTLGFPFNFHSLRHTHATLLLEGGASAKEVQVRLGHSRIATTLDTYVHLTDKKKRATASLFDDIAKLK